ncbi:glycosyltransferase family 2 protein [Pseudobutyrivibrio xylanivorans]|uniref:Glycosyl transferase family 2 n=1 Tax=Pseudobutyrivibrio xylanivorans TaxID=185007 RepID=A0A1G5RPP1_PSEXY|nr:glycosyltransferase family A protein [Pseudobutyrivibrio xylanivorans]SCZ76082.1 Glycosyl transferase family 2 [Pseudobutyrivibrio xylanivorans]
MVKVSVIIPIYNAEVFLETTLSYILNQTLRDIEIICIDDGSTDSSLEILHLFKKKDKRIVVVSQSNQYAGAARNRGIEMASGEYLSFLDADDYFSPDMLEKAYNAAVSTESDLVVFGGKCFERSVKNAYPQIGYARGDLVEGRDIVNINTCPDCIFNITNPAPWNKLVSKKLIDKENLRFQKCRRGNDVYFVEMLLILARKITVLSDCLIYYRKPNGNSLQAGKDENPDYFVNPFRDVYNELNKRNIYENVKVSFSNLFIASCIYNLESLNDKKAFNNLYQKLRNTIFIDFRIDELIREGTLDFYNSKKIQFIMNHDADEYGLYGVNYEIVDNPDKRFPCDLIGKGETIILYGAGNVGICYYKQLLLSNYCIIDKWVDKNKESFEGVTIYKPDKVRYKEVDHVLIAIGDKKIAEEIENYLITDLKVNRDIIVWKGF